MSKIIVAGGGHGGIAAAAILARNGFDVTVYEKNARENMGYDWTDIFDRKGFTLAGMDLPAPELYRLKTDMTFFSPSRAVPVRQQTPPDQLELQMERRDIYNHIIAHAEKNGVKFEYETTVLGPVLLGSRVAGIKTDKGNVYADLVIDAAGVSSPVRSQLPASLMIQNAPLAFEKFYVYRAFYERTDEIPEDNFRIYLLPNGSLGIDWVAIEEEHTDVLIGRFEPLTEEKVKDELKFLQSIHPALGDKKVRGGQFVSIPVRQPLGKLVADGYAAIGDSAFMTVPLIGSGIANSLKAARYLADAVSEDAAGAFTAQTLYSYQKNFFANLGSGLAPIACIKLLLADITPAELDYLFKEGILDSEMMTMGADTTSVLKLMQGVDPKALLNKGKGIIKDKVLLKKLAKMAGRLAGAVSACASMPKLYNEKAVNTWVKLYNGCFELK